VTRRLQWIAALAVCTAAVACTSRPAAEPRLIVATTHTLEDSGLLDSITAGFKAAHPEQKLEVVVAGSGEVLRIAARGDADAVLTHSPQDEDAFVKAGHGFDPQGVAHNDFIVAGPTTDAAHIASAASAVDAFTRIRNARQTFVSRADDSGTHKMELGVWKAAGIAPDSTHYIQAGVGMADALRIADQRNAYILTDVATFAALGSSLSLEQLYGGDPTLQNRYTIIRVTGARNAKGAQVFAEWILGNDAQRMISRYGLAKYGRALFTGDAASDSKK
jgi:tungstate transport system substrate-binding protein